MKHLHASLPLIQPIGVQRERASPQAPRCQLSKSYKKKKKKKIEVEMNKHKNITHICISRRLALSPTKVLNVCIRKKKT
jgi:hypothetical protein